MFANISLLEKVEAIRSGMNHGLTMVVGPPGTGKTDVTVQTIANLYHNYPNQHTLIVTHSNQALNQIFEKIMELGKPLTKKKSVLYCFQGFLINIFVA